MNRFFSVFFPKERIKGITILEIILVLGIMMLLIGTSLTSLSTYRNRQVLNTETSQVLSFFNKARTETLASKSQLAYGVRINADRIILFPAPTFASSTAENEQYILHHSVAITDNSLIGGGLDVIFARLTGETSSYGTFRITLLSDPIQYHTIAIKETGFVGIQD